MKNNRLAITLAALLVAMTIAAQTVDAFVTRQMTEYPKSRLIDLYKSCFQDYMGAEHLIADKASVRDYLIKEIALAAADSIRPDKYFEPCGIDGRHVRVFLCAVNDSLISADTLFAAFLASADKSAAGRVDKWRKRWKKIQAKIDKMNLRLPNYEDDRQFIERMLNDEHYAVSHSPNYREAYHPHYRIVERSIFCRDILPHLSVRLKNSAPL